MKLLCLPSASGNPYQRLMYGQLATGTEVIYASLAGLRHLSNPDIGIVHIHWDDRLFGRNKDDAEVAATLENAKERLRAFQARGGRVVWTVHNRDPHKVINLAGFVAGRQALSDMADVIHVHAPHARDHLIETYRTAADKISVVPHPSYLGAYEDAATTLGRPLPQQDTRSFLFFGMFRGEKGVHKIRDVAGKLTKRDVPYSLRMYGKAFASQARLLRILDANANVDLRTDRIPDEELPAIFGQSQVFLAPYDSLFTSGSVMLALTFGLPVIGPDVRELRETTPPAIHPLLYDPAAPRGLIKSMLHYVNMDDAELAQLRAACLAFAVERSPPRISRQFSKQLAPTV